MSNIDLLICRNVLIYFNADIQKSILNRLHFALKEAGFLVLGRAEAIISDQPTFKIIDWKQRIYTKGEPLTLPDVLTIMPKSF
jgi:two-component system CheB/CheR fusion protein